MIEVTTHPVGSNVQLLEGTGLAQLTIAGSVNLPTPQGLMPIPAVMFNFTLSREAAEMLHSQIGSVKDELPKQSDIAVATSMADVEQAAKASSIFVPGQ